MYLYYYFCKYLEFQENIKEILDHLCTLILCSNRKKTLKIGENCLCRLDKYGSLSLVVVKSAILKKYSAFYVKSSEILAAIFLHAAVVG